MDIEKLLEHTVYTIHQAGRLVLKYYRTSSYAVWDKKFDNPVTDADLAVDTYLKKHLCTHTPDFGWLSEETVDSPERLDKKWVWVVDPIDGTKEFIKGIDEFSISIGLVLNGRPVMGVVHNPAKNQTFAGTVEKGLTHVPEKARHLRNRNEVKDAEVLISATEHSRGIWSPHATELKLKPTGSTAYKLALVAAGLGDAYATLRPKNEWDYCAGAALILAAGGLLSDLDGRPLIFNRKKTTVNGIVAANAALHAGLMDLLGNARAASP